VGDKGARNADSQPPANAPSQQLPRSLARGTEVISIVGTLLSMLALIAALLFSAGTSRIALAALAGVFFFLFAPTWIVGTYDAVQAGKRTSKAGASRADFWATWGLVGVVSHLIARRHR